MSSVSKGVPSPSLRRSQRRAGFTPRSCFCLRRRPPAAASPPGEAEQHHRQHELTLTDAIAYRLRSVISLKRLFSEHGLVRKSNDWVDNATQQLDAHDDQCRNGNNGIDTAFDRTCLTWPGVELGSGSAQKNTGLTGGRRLLSVPAWSADFRGSRGLMPLPFMPERCRAILALALPFSLG